MLRSNRLPQLSSVWGRLIPAGGTRETPDVPAEPRVRRAEADRNSAGFVIRDRTFETGLSAQWRHFRDVQERRQDIEHDRWRSRPRGRLSVL